MKGALASLFIVFAAKSVSSTPYPFNEPFSVEARLEGSTSFLTESLDSLTARYFKSGNLQNYDGLESSLDWIVSVEPDGRIMVSVGENAQTYDKLAPEVIVTFGFGQAFNANVASSQYPFNVDPSGNDLTVSLLPINLTANTFQQRYVIMTLNPVPDTGSTAALLGAGVAALAFVKRRLG